MIRGESKLVVLGISHKTSTISERERLQINRKELKDALNFFREKENVEGIVIVSTCNRLEFYMVLNDDKDSFSLLTDYYKQKGIQLTNQLKDKFYFYKEVKTAEHLFKVITGLDSMLPGEYQVQGQIKDAYSIACSEKTADKILHKLFHAAFRVGKSIRTKTRIGSGCQSISGVVFKILKEKLDEENFISLIGVNQSIKILADKLFKAGFTNLNFINRTLYKAEELADKYDGIAFNLEDIETAISNSKCIISCTGSSGYILNSKTINKIYLSHKKLNLLIDMAVPRDINSDGLDNKIEYIDLEGLKKYLEKEKEEIEIDFPEAEKIISDEAKIFDVWNESQKDDNQIFIDEKMEIIRVQLLNEMKLNKSETEVELLDKFSRSLVHRMKSTIIQSLKTCPELAELDK